MALRLSLVRSIVFIFNRITKPTTHSFLFRVRALYTKAPRPASPTELPTGSPSPAKHFFYLFENDSKVAEFVANVFKALVACVDGHDCLYNVVFCETEGRPDIYPGGCSTPPGRYGYVRAPNQYSGPQSLINGQVHQKGGGVVFSCPAGRDFPPIATPCSATPGRDNAGSALLAQLLQVDLITKIDIPFLESKTKWQNITVQALPGQPELSSNEKAAQGLTLLELGFGVNGNGLREWGLANAQNYVEFAKWSWDLNYGDAVGLSGERCDDEFELEVGRSGAQPITG
ncbi:MAG: hypothetical protein L6R42_007890 [Xanthoria sp. 1 TBL-2021]|nr:MAG: hypothetical protein L6R42_007890 [Xanthoria sp. 1 TBL-2021]